MKLIQFILSLCLFGSLSAQPPQILPVEIIGQSQGVTSRDNRFCLKDSEGYFWFSSITGLYQFDGVKSRHFTSNSPAPYKLHGRNINGFIREDAFQNIWFSSTEAVHCYDRKSDAFNQYRLPDKEDGVYFLIDIDKDQNIWFYCNDSLYTLNTETQEFKFISSIFSAAQRAEIYKNESGYVTKVYVYGLDGINPGFQCIEIERNSPISSKYFLSEKSSSQINVRDVHIQNDSIIWLADKNGLIHFNVNTQAIKKFRPKNQAPNIYFNAIGKISDSTFLITSYSQGVFEFNINTKVFTGNYHLYNNDHPITNKPQAIYVDAQSGVWISIAGTGVAFFHPDNLNLKSYSIDLTTSLSESSINPNALIELNNHEVWGTSFTNGGFILDTLLNLKQTFHKNHPTDWTSDNTFVSVKDSSQNIWALTKKKVLVISPDKTINSIKGIDNSQFQSLTPINEGRVVLLNTESQLYESKASKNGEFTSKKVKDLDSSAYPYFLFSNANKIYCFYYQSHFEVLDPNNQYNSLLKQPLQCNVNCIQKDPNTPNLILGTDNGLYSLNTNTYSIDSFSWAKPIANLAVMGIVAFTDGNLWISTNNGIYRLDPTSQSLIHFGVENGSSSSTFNANASLFHSNGDLWFGTNRGITIVNPANLKQCEYSPKLNITKILINDEPYDRHASSNKATGIKQNNAQLSIPFHQNTLGFEFAAINYAGIGKSEYEFKMNGYDKDWIHSSTRGFARYANLPAGNYSFDVRAHDPVNNKTGEIRTVDIQIIPPLYQRPWFIITSFTIGAGLFFLLIRINEQRKLKLQQLRYEKRIALETERLRIANDMHDDVGSGLSALSLRAKLMESAATEPKLRTELHEFIESTSHLAQKIRDIIWTINAKNDTIDNLVTRLHQYATDYFDGSDIQCKVALTPTQILTSIPGDHRRDIYLCFKEALHNIIKHAKASTVHISIDFVNDHQLQIHIKDDGIGFDHTENNKGIGLKSMQQRMLDTGGSLDVSSDPKGTSIKLKYPF